MITNIKRGIISSFHRAIASLWVSPLEAYLIPFLNNKRSGPVRDRLLRSARWSADAGRVLVMDLRLHLVRWSCPDWSITYIGNGYTSEALCWALFPKSPQVIEKRRISLWQVPELVQQYCSQGDLVICEMNEIIRISPKGVNLSISIPPSVRQVIDGLDRPVEVILAGIERTVRSRIQRLEVQGYSYRVTRTRSDFDLFYRRMFTPYVQQRFSGRGPIFKEYADLHQFFRKGALILALREGQPVAGVLGRPRGDLWEGGPMGVLDGRYDLVKQGANVALWWYVLVWARTEGFLRFDLGTSLPFVANGVFTFKRQWSSRVLPDEENNIQWKFFGKNISPMLRSHINDQGWITTVSGKLYWLVLVDSPATYADSVIIDKRETAMRYGLSGLALVSPQGEMKVIG